MAIDLINFKTVGVLGLLCICAAMIVRHRTTRDILGMFGGVCLLIYSLYLKDLIFIILQSVYIIVIVIDFINKKLVQGTND